MFPIRYPQIWEIYKKVEASLWISKEVDLSQDIHHWDQSLKSDKHHLVTRILAFFTVADGIIIENLAGWIWTEVSLLDSMLADGTALICGVAQTMHAVGKNMAFLVVRQFNATIKCVLIVTEELVSTQMVSTHMVRYTTSLYRESIVDIKGEATEILKAFYSTLNELALVGSPGSHHRPSLPEV
ncbi:hypothetical protein IEQ34_010882 [Dendrobium chrysotoxum]|uniref:Uncharacterized protein n=1 Tax=Dendrobium chrysotoxum TaxID=161865 RepID=A0AAV7GXN5_DENCH|nr:hypothetical protein IEQ34_010882 [Dendrobium chrysotoxum]